MNDKIKILVIAYFYPPISTIGSIRTWKLVKYIKMFGYEPIVICGETDEQFWKQELPHVEVHRIKCDILFEKFSKKINKKVKSDGSLTKLSSSNDVNFLLKVYILRYCYFILKRIKPFLNEIFEYPDSIFKWRKKVLPIASKIIELNSIALIYSSSGPVTDHLIANDLSRKFGISWVADYRDLWTKNHYIAHTSLRKYFEEKLELRTLSGASSIVTVSGPAAKIQSDFLNKPVQVITNGFDPEDYDFNVQPYEIFTIIYTGVIYFGKRDPIMLFEAVKNLIERRSFLKNKIRIKFFGADKLILEKILKKYDIDEVVEIYDRIPLNQAIIEQKRASALLLLMYNHMDEKGVYTGKIFEYLGAKRPILVIPTMNGSVVDDLLEKTRAGVSCSSVEEIEDVLLNWYERFYSAGNLPYEGIDQEIEKYSRMNQAKQFAKLFDSLTNSDGKII